MSAPDLNSEPVPVESGRSVLFAAGTRGQRLFIPAGVTLADISRPVVEQPLISEAIQRERVVTALAGSSLKELASDKRRVAVLVGDLVRPAPYDIALPALLATLVEAGIRPSRVAFLACPGGCGPLLGRSAIHRYGEEICGDHDAIAWPADGSPDALYESADLRIAVSSARDGVEFNSFLPQGVNAEFSLELTLGRAVQIEIESARAFVGTALPKKPSPISKSAAKADVMMVSGGGSPWEETLEEALLSLHVPGASADTAVLVFSGSDGLGASRFSRDLWSLIEQAEEVLATGKSLGKPSASPGAFDPANVLAECLKRYKHTVLFSREFAEHFEGDDLIDRLAEAPHVAARLGICGSHAALWQLLELTHGSTYSIHAEPLGWRA
ncbi:MAG: lactate racemase domain-containing protein [Planctomycetota bacterium]